MGNKVTQSVFYAAAFLTVGAGIVATRKGILWAGNKALDIAMANKDTVLEGGQWALDRIEEAVEFTFKEGAISAPITTGVLAGGATMLSFKYSPLAAKHQFPLRSKDYAVENRMIVIALAAFATTLAGVHLANRCISSHRITLGGAFGYASTAAIATVVGTVFADEIYIHHINQKGYHSSFWDCIFERSDRNLETEYEWNTETSDVQWDNAAAVSLGVGVTTTFVAAVSYFAIKVIGAIHKNIPSTQGVYPAALIMATAFVGTKSAIDKYDPEHQSFQDQKRILAPFVAMLAAGSLLTPMVSSFMLKNRVGYLSSMGISTAATVGNWLAHFAIARYAISQTTTEEEW